jgi:uncharacterized protein (TIGR03067 family)
MKYLTLLASAYLLAAGVHGAEIKGTVKSVSGDTVSVAIEGDVMPPVGAKAEIFFKLPGDEEEISVATGSALAIDHGDLKVKIEKTTGTVEKGQLVRFPASSTSTTGSTTTTSKPATLPANNPPTSNKPSLVGEWHRVYQPLLFTFRPDGAAQIVDHGEQIAAKYRVDYSQKPWQLDLFDFSSAPEAQKDVVLKAICKIEDDTFYFSSNEPGQERPTEFLKHMNAGVRDPHGPAPNAESPLVGTWNLETSKQIYTFTDDGKLHTYWESSGAEPSTNDMRYELDESATPMRLNFYYREANGNPNWRGIIEFESDTRMRLDGEYTSKEEERPKNFRDKAEVFTRASPTSP